MFIQGFHEYMFNNWFGVSAGAEFLQGGWKYDKGDWMGNISPIFHLTPPDENDNLSDFMAPRVPNMLCPTHRLTTLLADSYSGNLRSEDS